MTKSEQDRLFQDLVPLEYAMNGQDKELFRQLLSRHKDEEDLDTFASARLEKLHATYKPSRSKKELEDIWKKMTSGENKG